MLHDLAFLVAVLNGGRPLVGPRRAGRNLLQLGCVPAGQLAAGELPVGDQPESGSPDHHPSHGAQRRDLDVRVDYPGPADNGTGD